MNREPDSAAGPLPPGPLRNGNRRGDPNAAPRCGALNRAGQPCRAPAMANGRCHRHGGASTGPRTPEGQAASRAASVRHGYWSQEQQAWRAAVREMLRRARRVSRMDPEALEAEFYARLKAAGDRNPSPPLGAERSGEVGAGSAKAAVKKRIDAAG